MVFWLIGCGQQSISNVGVEAALQSSGCRENVKCPRVRPPPLLGEFPGHPRLRLSTGIILGVMISWNKREMADTSRENRRSSAGRSHRPHVEGVLGLMTSNIEKYPCQHFTSLCGPGPIRDHHRLMDSLCKRLVRYVTTPVSQKIRRFMAFHTWKIGS